MVSQIEYGNGVGGAHYAAFFIGKKLQANVDLNICVWFLWLAWLRTWFSFGCLLPHWRASFRPFPVHVQDEKDFVFFETEMAAADADNGQLLVQIFRHFPSTQCIDVLVSTCRRAVARAAETKGVYLHKVRRSVMQI